MGITAITLADKAAYEVWIPRIETLIDDQFFEVRSELDEWIREYTSSAIRWKYRGSENFFRSPSDFVTNEVFDGHKYWVVCFSGLEDATAFLLRWG